MGTTISDSVDRQGGACSKAELEDVLAKTRRVLADVSTKLEAEIDRLDFAIEGEKDDKRQTALKEMSESARKTFRTVVDIEAKLGLSLYREGPETLDLEAARVEILDKLAILAA